VENGTADEARPDVHRLERAAGELREAPHRVSLGDMRFVVRLQRTVELDDAADKSRREDAHAAVVEEIDRLDPARAALPRGRDGVTAEMRIAVADSIAQERAPP